MKQMAPGYGVLAIGIPVLMGMLCLLPEHVPIPGGVVYVIPLALLGFFLGRLSAVNCPHKALHAIGGILCMIVSWALSILVLGVYAIATTGLRGTQ